MSGTSLCIALDVVFRASMFRDCKDTLNEPIRRTNNPFAESGTKNIRRIGIQPRMIVWAGPMPKRLNNQALRQITNHGANCIFAIPDFLRTRLASTSWSGAAFSVGLRRGAGQPASKPRWGHPNSCSNSFVIQSRPIAQVGASL